MAVSHQNQHQEGLINGGDNPPNPVSSSTTLALENVGSKRQRKPSVRLGDIGEQPASKHGKGVNKMSKTRPLTNLSTLEENPDGEFRDNLDNLAIGSWKFKGSKSKRVRTNWGSRTDEGEDGFSRDFEMDEESHDFEAENDRDLGFRVGNDNRVRIGDDDGVALDCHDDGVRVWLSGLGLGRYWPVFKIHEVDEEILPLITLEDLKDMGISAVGSRRKMFCAIQKLSKVFS